MPGSLAIVTVGSQEVQADLFADRVRQRLGPDVMTAAREIGEFLEELDDNDLREAIPPEALRNTPCFDEIDASTPDERAWSVALLATDQPEDVPDRFRAGDTVGIARVVSRLLRLRYGEKVQVLAPLVLHSPPHLADDALAEEIRTLVHGAIAETAPDEVFALTVGATPAIRILTELAAGKETTVPLRRLAPNANGSGTLTTSLLTYVERDAMANALEAGLLEAFDLGRFRAALALVDQLEGMGRGTVMLRRLCRIAVRIAEDDSDPLAEDRRHVARDIAALIGSTQVERVVARLEARIHVIARAESDGRVGEALLHHVEAAEFAPYAVTLWSGIGEEDVMDRVAAPDHSVQCAHDANRWVPPDRGSSRDPVLAARTMLRCVSVSCERCPLGDLQPLVAVSTARARIVTELRERRGSKVIELRNRWAHAGVAGRYDLQSAIEEEWRHLERLGVQRSGATTGLSGVLSLVFQVLFGREPRDPFLVIRRGIERCLDG